MEYVWLIFRTDLRPLFSGGKKKVLARRLSLLAGVLAYGGLAAGVGYGAFKLFSLLRGFQGIPETVRSAIEINVLNGVTLFSLVMVFLSGMQTTYKVIFESDDIGFLMAQPVPIQAIFTAKFISAYASIAAVAVPFGLPVWISYGLVVDAGPLFWAVVAVLLGLLLLVAHSAVSLALLAAMRYLPGRKMKQLFVGASAVLGVLVVLLSQMLSSQIQRTSDPAEMLEILSRGSLAGPWYLPSSWMVGSALAMARRSGAGAVRGAAALLVSAGLMSVAAVRLSRRWFTAGWSGRTEETGSRSKGRIGSRDNARLPWPRGSYAAVLAKDLRLLRRDPLVWYNLLVGAIVVGFFIFNMSSMSSGQPGRGPSGEEADLVGALALFMPVMMGSVTGAQTGGISISREGPSFWLVRGSPVSARGFFWAKMTYALLPPATLLLATVLAMRAVGLALLPLGLALALGGSMVLAVSSLQILLDIFFPDFTLKIEFGSSKSGRGTGKLLTAVFSSMGLVALLTFIAALPGTPLSVKVFPGLSNETVVWIARSVVVSLGLFGLFSARFLGVRRLEKILTDM